MIIIDDFIKDKNLLEEIELTPNFFPESMGDEERIATVLNSYHDEKSDCFAPYMFWDGWLNSEADTPRKRLIKKIWENNLPFPIEEVCGFEYWTRTFKPGQFLDVHVDEDTFLYADKKIFKGPKIGCVYYPHTNDVVGGFLEMHPTAIPEDAVDALERENVDPLIVPIELRERISCKPNRLIIFDAGHVIHNTTPPIKGVRRVVVVNVWHKDNPPSALKTGEFYYE
jgi:hypothetical protein